MFNGFLVFEAITFTSDILKKVKVFPVVFLSIALPAYSQWGTGSFPNCFLTPELCKIPPSENVIRKLPSAFDPEATSQHLKSSTPEYAVVRMRIIQEMRSNPNIYWAFEFAGKGSEGWEFFERSEKMGDWEGMHYVLLVGLA